MIANFISYEGDEFMLTIGTKFLFIKAPLSVIYRLQIILIPFCYATTLLPYCRRLDYLLLASVYK